MPPPWVGIAAPPMPPTTRFENTLPAPAKDAQTAPSSWLN